MYNCGQEDRPLQVIRLILPPSSTTAATPPPTTTILLVLVLPLPPPPPPLQPLAHKATRGQKGETKAQDKIVREKLTFAVGFPPP